LSPDDFDFDDGWLSIRRQVKRVGSRLVFGLPKNDKERRVPICCRKAAVGTDGAGRPVRRLGRLRRPSEIQTEG
jgi:hypothetical protein